MGSEVAVHDENRGLPLVPKTSVCRGRPVDAHVPLLVAVSFLQQGASVEIDDYLLEPIY